MVGFSGSAYGAAEQGIAPNTINALAFGLVPGMANAGTKLRQLITLSAALGASLAVASGTYSVSDFGSRLATTAPVKIVSGTDRAEDVVFDAGHDVDGDTVRDVEFLDVRHNVYISGITFKNFLRVFYNRPTNQTASITNWSTEYCRFIDNVEDLWAQGNNATSDQLILGGCWLGNYTNKIGIDDAVATNHFFMNRQVSNFRLIDNVGEDVNGNGLWIGVESKTDQWNSRSIFVANNTFNRLIGPDSTIDVNGISIRCMDFVCENNFIDGVRNGNATEGQEGIYAKAYYGTLKFNTVKNARGEAAYALKGNLASRDLIYPNATPAPVYHPTNERWQVIGNKAYADPTSDISAGFEIIGVEGEFSHNITYNARNWAFRFFGPYTGHISGRGNRAVNTSATVVTRLDGPIRNFDVEVIVDGHVADQNAATRAYAWQLTHDGAVTISPTGNTTSGSYEITNVSGDLSNVTYFGYVYGTGIPDGTLVTDVSGTSVFISKAATATATGVSLTLVNFVPTTGDIVNGSATISNVAAPLNIEAGWIVVGTGIDGAAAAHKPSRVKSISGSTITMDQPATATTNTLALKFIPPMQNVILRGSVTVGPENVTNGTVGQGDAVYGVRLAALATNAAFDNVEFDIKFNMQPPLAAPIIYRIEGQGTSATLYGISSKHSTYAGDPSATGLLQVVAATAVNSAIYDGPRTSSASAMGQASALINSTWFKYPGKTQLQNDNGVSYQAPGPTTTTSRWIPLTNDVSGGAVSNIVPV